MAILCLFFDGKRTRKQTCFHGNQSTDPSFSLDIAFLCQDIATKSPPEMKTILRFSRFFWGTYHLKGLFTWRSGTPGRWGNPPVHIISYLIWSRVHDRSGCPATCYFTYLGSSPPCKMALNLGFLFWSSRMTNTQRTKEAKSEEKLTKR